jgi:uncharacterized Zn-binding protein involved in type VI secretion
LIVEFLYLWRYNSVFCSKLPVSRWNDRWPCPKSQSAVISAGSQAVFASHKFSCMAGGLYIIL